MLRLFFAAGLIALPASAFAVSDHCDGSFCYQKKARVSCLQPGVWDMLHKLTGRIGRIEITSACDGKHAHHSYHYKGLAVDFRPMQTSTGSALAALHAMPEVGGIGTYGTGMLHADIRSYRVAWHHNQRGFARYAQARHRFARYAQARQRLARYAQARRPLARYAQARQPVAYSHRGGFRRVAVR